MVVIAFFAFAVLVVAWIFAPSTKMPNAKS
jgi:cbb3-type cytochrome oxidase subunit 3